MLKFLGAVFTIVSCGLLGLAVAGQIAQRPRQLRALQTSLKLLETEILYGATPLPEAFRRLARISQPPVNLLFAANADLLEEGRASTAAEAWAAAVRRFQAISSLTATDLEALLALGLGLGASDRREQVKNLNLVLRHLQQLEVNAEEARRKNEQVWRNMGFLVGMALTLLFL